MIRSISCPMTHPTYSSGSKNPCCFEASMKASSEICSDCIFNITARHRWSLEWPPYSQSWNLHRREILSPSPCSVLRSMSRVSLTFTVQGYTSLVEVLGCVMGRTESDLWECGNSELGKDGLRAGRWILKKLGIRRKRNLAGQVGQFSMTTPST